MEKTCIQKTVNLKSHYAFLEAERLEAEKALKVMKKRDKGKVSIYIKDLHHTIFRVRKGALKKRLKHYKSMGLEIEKVL